jgi:hypothetical protein
VVLPRHRGEGRRRRRAGRRRVVASRPLRQCGRTAITLGLAPHAKTGGRGPSDDYKGLQSFSLFGPILTARRDARSRGMHDARTRAREAGSRRRWRPSSAGYASPVRLPKPLRNRIIEPSRLRRAEGRKAGHMVGRTPHRLPDNVLHGRVRRHLRGLAAAGGVAGRRPLNVL